MKGDTVGGVPATIVFTLVISFFAFFASVTCVTLYYYKRDPRRLERLLQLEWALEAQETVPLGIGAETPMIWQVWADRHPKPTSKLEDLLPLNLTYEQGQPSNRGLSLYHTQPSESNERPRSRLDTTNCNLSVFILMPSPHEFGGEFAIGTAETLYPHPELFHM